jgi:hypothetical protein
MTPTPERRISTTPETASEAKPTSEAEFEDMPPVVDLFKYLRIPCDLARFTTLVGHANLPCSCDDCNAALYIKGVRLCHKRLDMSLQTKNRYGHMVTAVPVLAGTYCAMNMAWESIFYVDKPFEVMNKTQLDAVDRFKHLWRIWAEPMMSFDGPDTVPDRVLSMIVHRKPP